MPTLSPSNLCNGCSACQQTCPKNCITMQPDAEGFLRPVVDTQSCVSCGRCESVCTVLNPIEITAPLTGCYAAYNTVESEREKASSGGVFLLLARWVINRGGVVFGAVFQEDFTVSHCYAEIEEAVYAFCGSKYVQSRLDNSYREVRKFLGEGRYVLFTGTPCQVLGLYHYLGGIHERLLTADIICHGVPSPDVWKRYVNERSQKDNNGSIPKAIRFRMKDTGWSNYSVHFQYDSNCYSKPFYEDTYMHGFLKNLYLRPSCHNCIAKGIGRVSDFTLADFWGVQRILPDMYDNRGTSLVLLHTEKAATVWSQISKQVNSEPTDAEAAVASNSAAVRSVDCHAKREEFFARYQNEDLDTLVWELAPKEVPARPTLVQRIRGKIGRICRKFFASFISRQ